MGMGWIAVQKLEIKENDRSWLMSSLHQIFSRRYFLRRSALKLFMIDWSNFFFDFGSTEGRRNAYWAIVRARPLQLSNVYLATQRPEQLLKRTQLMERWARWKISNFEYLMQFNTLAGRSYNDITQVIFLDNYPSMSNNSMHWLNFFDRFCFPFSVSCFPMDSLWLQFKVFGSCWPFFLPRSFKGYVI